MNNIKKRITIIGAGNSGLAIAAHLSLNGEDVVLWNRTLKNIESLVKDPTIKYDGVINGSTKLRFVTDDLAKAVKNSNLILVTIPASGHKSFAKLLAPLLESKMTIVLIPGRTFGAIEFWNELDKNGVIVKPIIAETQTVIYTCRRTGSNSVRVYKFKKNVLISCLKNNNNELLFNLLPTCMVKHLRLVESILDTSFGNIGMILHVIPVILNTGWIESDTSSFKYYYEGISKSISELIEKMDEERLKIGLAIGIKSLSIKEWMMSTYEVYGENLFSCIQNNESYKEIDAPKTLEHRYLYEEVPCGLVPMEFLAKQLDIKTPIMTSIIDMSILLTNTDFRYIGRSINLDSILKIKKKVETK